MKISNQQRQAIIEEIADNWKLEARSEDSDRYFFNYQEIRRIKNGSKCYVIGRKGTGKTAISEYLYHLKKESNVFTEKLTFKNFPFNELYSLSNDQYTTPNQYITLWKYLIYSFICRMMLKNPSVNESVRRKLANSYSADPITNLPRVIGTWTDNSFQIDESGRDVSWIEKVNILEDIIMSNLNESKYYIIFDELDEDYRTINSKEEFEPYSNLMTSLFKAVQDIKNIFRNRDHHIYPVVFLRDDIYRLIQDADKNKWSDFKIGLDWNKKKIQNLLAFRITKAFDPSMHELRFRDAWGLIFDYRPVPMGNRQQREMKSYDFIERSTQLRPRDFIKYVQACAENTLEGNWSNYLIHPKTIKWVDKAFSNYMKDEIIDEIHPIIPDIQSVFQVFSQIRKQVLSIDEFKELYNEYLDSGTVREANINLVLQTLYDFSVIGNEMKNHRSIFRYMNREARLNFSENITIHRGLYKSLQIL